MLLLLAVALLMPSALMLAAECYISRWYRLTYAMNLFTINLVG
jgi:hypothetical protein